ncbi:hypothetical protein HMPREF1317_0544 [Schaalia georgiae F0490]|uniref:Uncharacterized protein n=1 Tax=Schaalia georgiae F0490 TaxID=1125717 RepID=J1HM40_9ACTO|nr:hypothetical protein HMPREF1317_0544 [Schaalia georgiae F0490]
MAPHLVVEGDVVVVKVGSNWCEWPRGLVPTACRYPQASDAWGD